MNFFCLESHILSFPKVLQIPPESPCIYNVRLLRVKNNEERTVGGLQRKSYLYLLMVDFTKLSVRQGYILSSEAIRRHEM